MAALGETFSQWVEGEGMSADLDLAIVEAEAVVARLKAIRDRPVEDPLVPVKVAAEIWGICENAALKRMRRIGAKGMDGRWYARRSVVGAACRQDGASGLSGCGKVTRA